MPIPKDVAKKFQNGSCQKRQDASVGFHLKVARFSKFLLVITFERSELKVMSAHEDIPEI